MCDDEYADDFYDDEERFDDIVLSNSLDKKDNPTPTPRIKRKKIRKEKKKAITAKIILPTEVDEIDFKKVRVKSAPINFVGKSRISSPPVVESFVAQENRLSPIAIGKQLDMAIKRIENYSKINADLSKKLESARDESEIDKLRKQVQTQFNTIQELITEKKALDNLNRVKEKQLQEMLRMSTVEPDSDHEQRFARLRERFTKLQKDNIQLRQKNRFLLNENSELKTELSFMKTNLSSHQAPNQASSNTSFSKRESNSEQSREPALLDVDQENDPGHEDNRTSRAVEDHLWRVKYNRLEQEYKVLQKAYLSQQTVLKQQLNVATEQLQKHKEEVNSLNQELNTRERQAKSQVCCDFF